MQLGVTFIVRFYRLGQGKPTGVVEDVRTGKRTPFSSSETLWAALTKKTSRRRPATTPSKTVGLKGRETLS
ncbi:MAG TPA: hypothetical protein VFB20_00615 [Burkholderiales bacterium]|nr:hypothetical protein [Burkholderiales bacterium]